MNHGSSARIVDDIADFTIVTKTDCDHMVEFNPGFEEPQ